MPDPDWNGPGLCPNKIKLGGVDNLRNGRFAASRLHKYAALVCFFNSWNRFFFLFIDFEKLHKSGLVSIPHVAGEEVDFCVVQIPALTDGLDKLPLSSPSVVKVELALPALPALFSEIQCFSGHPFWPRLPPTILPLPPFPGVIALIANSTAN